MKILKSFYGKLSLLLIIISSLILINEFIQNESTEIIPIEKTEEQVKSENSKKRQAWWSELNGPPPSVEQLTRTKKEIKKQVKGFHNGNYRDAGINDWESLGPFNIGGRIRAVAINPSNTQEIFIGAAAGGIWRSINGGSSWGLVTPELIAYPVTYIAYHPDDSNIMLATTGEFTGSSGVSNPGGFPPSGVGVLKSIDGGITWSKTILTGDSVMHWLSKVIFNPENPNVVYAVGSNAGIDRTSATGQIYKSIDAGNIWIPFWKDTVDTPHSTNISDIEINPSDTTEMLIGTHREAMISNDVGITWTSLMGTGTGKILTPNSYTGRRCEVSYCESDPDQIYVLRYLTSPNLATGAGRSEVWHSPNGGANWGNSFSNESDDASTSILKNQGNYDNTLWVDPTDCTRYLLGGINIWKVHNGSLLRISEWRDDIGGNNASSGDNNSIHADQHLILPDPNYNGTGNQRVYIANDGGLYKSEFIWQATQNSGWSSLVPGLNITQLYGVDPSASGEVIVGGSQDNSYFTNQNGNSGVGFWKVYGTGDGGHGAVNKSDPDIIYSSTQEGNFIKSEDGGNSFEDMIDLKNVKIDTPIFIAPFEMDPDNNEVLFAGGRRLWKSSDAGDDWSSISFIAQVGNTRVSTTTIELAKGSNAQTIVLGYQIGLIRRTTNGGSNWTTISTPTLPDRYVTDIAINPNNHNEMFATFGGAYNNTSIWYTADAGANWINRSPSFDILPYTIIWHPFLSNWIYVGTDQGIFASENKGLNWNVTPLYSENEGPIYTPVVELVWQGFDHDIFPMHLVAATHGRGAWRTSYPIRNKYYVDIECNPCGSGSFERPYKSFSNAVAAAGNGSEIIFLTGGTYNNVSSSLLLEKRIKVSKTAGVELSVVIE